MIKKLLQIILIGMVLCVLPSCREGGSSDSPKFYRGWETPPDKPWTAITPAGIRIMTEMSTVAQYEMTWEGVFHWENIDWEVLDEEFEFYKEYYCYQLNWDCKDVIPSNLTVYIKPWDCRCGNEEDLDHPRRIYENINGRWQCVKAWYWEGVIYLHLGTDPGQDHTTIYSEDPISSVDFRAFQESPYSHELLHFFQEVSGLPFSEDVYYPPRPSYIIHLPDEETEEESNQ